MFSCGGVARAHGRETIMEQGYADPCPSHDEQVLDRNGMPKEIANCPEYETGIAAGMRLDYKLNKNYVLGIATLQMSRAVPDIALLLL